MSKNIVTIEDSPLCYKAMRKRVIDHFERRGYQELAAKGKSGQHQTRKYVYTCQSGARILLEFPGLKAGINKYQHYCYDYRVKYESNTASRVFSHVDLVLEIVWKIIDGVFSQSEIQEILRGITRGRITPDPLRYCRRQPPSNLLDITKRAYANKNKIPPTELEPIDLTPEELSASMFWILLQEDVNYPREQRLQGRQMGLNRYAEAVWAAVDVPSRLEKVLERTLTEKAKPPPLPACDYSYVTLEAGDL